MFNKPNGLLSHPNNKSNEKTLRDYLRQSELPELNPNDYQKEEVIEMLIDLDKNMFFDGRKD